jgi:predicted metalloenzyme YecM
MKHDDFIYQAHDFLDAVFEQLFKKKVVLPQNWSIDHICFRVPSEERYQFFVKAFAEFADLLIESPVNGRLISTFKLRQPICYFGRRIDLLELPAPKPHKETPEGFEHFEVVCDKSFAEIKEMYRTLEFDEAGSKKTFNSELELVLEGCAVKFHHLSLESVVTLEKNKRVFDALCDLRILETLAPFRPQVAGTFPLGIETEGSDVDIVMGSPDFDEMEKALRQNFSTCEKFQFHKAELSGEPGLVCSFEFHGIPFEVVGQNKESVRQPAYQHFQVEERLLKVGGPSLREKILVLRKRGVKTEPAFGEVLKIVGDPYETLSRWHSASEEQLEQRIFQK